MARADGRPGAPPSSTHWYQRAGVLLTVAAGIAVLLGVYTLWLHRIPLGLALFAVGASLLYGAALQRETYRLRQAALRAQTSDRFKGEFLANISHEIRTPLNGVIGLADLLLRSNLPPNEHHSVEVINASAETVLTLINDILDLSKIEDGKLYLNLNEEIYATFLKDLDGNIEKAEKNWTKIEHTAATAL